MAKYRVAAVDEVPVDGLKRVEVDGTAICLAHAEDGNYYAIDDTCTHEDYSLCEGEIWGLEVECPQHGSRFDLRTGQVRGLPAVIPARTFRVEVEDGDVYLDV